MTTSDRFWSKVEEGPIPVNKPELGPCWIWTGCVQSKGYPSVSVNGKTVQGHRFAYEEAFGPILDGCLPHHECEVKRCVRPDHVEALTNSEHNRRHNRGASLPRRVRIRVMGGICAHGHRLNEKNGYVKPDGEVACRMCARRWRKDYERRNTAKRLRKTA